MSFAQKFQQLTRRKSFKYGLPFLICIVGGSFGLREFAQIRYQFSKKHLIKPEDLEKHGLKMKSPKEVTLEAEYDKIKSMDIDNWDNIRGPRPWEEETLIKK